LFDFCTYSFLEFRMIWYFALYFALNVVLRLCNFGIKNFLFVCSLGTVLPPCELIVDGLFRMFSFFGQFDLFLSAMTDVSISFLWRFPLRKSRAQGRM
jgi:hypothetical protein